MELADVDANAAVLGVTSLAARARLHCHLRRPTRVSCRNALTDRHELWSFGRPRNHMLIGGPDPAMGETLLQVCGPLRVSVQQYMHRCALQNGSTTHWTQRSTHWMAVRIPTREWTLMWACSRLKNIKILWERASLHCHLRPCVLRKRTNRST